MLATGTPSGLWSHSFLEILKLDQTFLDIWELWRRQWWYWWQQYQGQRADNTSLEAEKLNVGLSHNGKKTNVPRWIPGEDGRCHLVPVSLPVSPGIVPALNLYHWNSQMIHQVTAFLYQYNSLLSSVWSSVSESTFAKVWESSSFPVQLKAGAELEKQTKFHCRVADYQLLDNSYFCAVNVGLADP